MLFCAIFRSHLEYCPLIWTNNTSKQIEVIESVYSSYELVLKCINLSPLKNICTLLLSTFLHNLLTYLLIGKIDCQELLSLIRSTTNFHNTRN